MSKMYHILKSNFEHFFYFQKGNSENTYKKTSIATKNVRFFTSNTKHYFSIDNACLLATLKVILVLYFLQVCSNTKSFFSVATIFIKYLQDITFDNFSYKSSENGKEEKIILYTFSSKGLTYLQLLESQARDLLISVKSTNPSLFLELDLIDRSAPSFLEQEERSRQQASNDRLTRKNPLKNQKKKAIRDSATLSDFLEAIKVINGKFYRCEFVRSREKISLLVLFLTGIRVANLLEVTASNLRSLLTTDTSVYFEVNAIKSRKLVVYRTFLSSNSLSLARKYKNEIVTLLEGKAPSDYVFTRKSSSFPLDRAALTKRLNHILRSAGKTFGKNLSSHSFRIGHVTLLIDQFGLLDAQKVIGHQNVETTLRYARNKLTSTDFTRKMQTVEAKKHNKLPRHKRGNAKSYVINDNCNQ